MSIYEKVTQYREFDFPYFVNTMLRFTPMYLANYCTNQCVYCGLKLKNDLVRKNSRQRRLKRKERRLPAAVCGIC